MVVIINVRDGGEEEIQKGTIIIIPICIMHTILYCTHVIFLRMYGTLDTGSIHYIYKYIVCIKHSDTLSHIII